MALLIYVVNTSKSRRHATIAGYICGVFCYGIGMNWLPTAFAHFTGRGLGMGFILATPVVVTLATKYALFACTLKWLQQTNSSAYGIAPAAIFVLLEALFSKVVSSPIATGLFSQTWLIQAADLSGMAGLDFLIVLITFLAVQSATAIATARRLGAAFRSILHAPAVLRPTAIGLALLVGWVSYGALRLARINAAHQQAPTFTVGIAQTNTHAPTGRLSPEQSLAVGKTIVHLAAHLASSTPRPDLIIYGESTAPLSFGSGRYRLFEEAYKAAARQSGIPLVVDNLRRETAEGREIFQRESLLLLPDGTAGATYQKRQLVPVGEYLPGETIWPGLRTFFPSGRTFKPGNGAARFSIKGIMAAPVICFEIMNARLTRQSAATGAQFLINPANDAWFQSDKEARQHFWSGAFRAVENRIPLVRAGNTGYSGVITAAGQIRTVSPPLQPWSAAVPLHLFKIPTLYTKAGNLFPWLCALIIAQVVIRLPLSKPQRRQ